MHEFSIAAQILENARDHAQENDAVSVDRLEIHVGEASHVNVSQLETCLAAASAETIAAGATFDVRSVAPYAECDCGWAGEPDGLDQTLVYAPDLQCPTCGERLTLSEGDSCHLVTIEMTTDESDHDDRPDERADSTSDTAT